MTEPKEWEVTAEQASLMYGREDVERLLGLDHKSCVLRYSVMAGKVPAPVHGPYRRLYWEKAGIDALVEKLRMHVDVREFAKMLGVTMGYMYQRRKRGDLPRADWIWGEKLYWKRSRAERFCMSSAAQKPLGQPGLKDRVCTGGFKCERDFLAEMDETSKHLGVTRSLLAHMAIDQFLNEFSPRRQAGKVTR